MLVLVRCDDRLIHGQCMTVLAQEYDIQSIIVADDETAGNPILRMVFETASTDVAPAAVCTAQEAAVKLKAAITSGERVLLLMKSPLTYLRLLELVDGLPKELNIGPMSKRPGAVSVTRAIHLLPEEGRAVGALAGRGVRVYFRQVPSERTVEWEQVKEKFQS